MALFRSQKGDSGPDDRKQNQKPEAVAMAVRFPVLLFHFDGGACSRSGCRASRCAG